MKKAWCFWRRDSDPDTDAWDGDCGAKWVLTDGTPSQNGMQFCPQCGAKLREIESRKAVSNP